MNNQPQKAQNSNLFYMLSILELDIPSDSEGLEALFPHDCPWWIGPGASPLGWMTGKNAGDGDIRDP